MNPPSVPLLGSLVLIGLIALGAAFDLPRAETPSTDTTLLPLHVMSFNIRYNNPDDGEHAWPNRTNRVASVIRFHQPGVAGLQEALIGQIRDLEERLPDYAWVGVGRADGEDGGEFSPIFYRTDRLELLDHGTFWLSETPEVPGSQSWDAALPRIVTWAQFRDRRGEGAKVFYHFNTHFDHRGEQARRESARLLLEQVDAIAASRQSVVTGDFNVTPDTEAYRILTERLEDARSLAEAPHGPPGTFSSFTVGNEANRRIDYIFLRRKAMQVERFGTLTDQWNGHYPSDHLPVLATVYY
jgi:endonuclease/exonuclease/phosphatase family metal-dependent hydrolase